MVFPLRAGLVIAVAMLMPTASVAAATPACAFVAPASAPAGAHAWLGPCRKGRAEGVGGVRTVAAGGRIALWFGRMQAGRPTGGVVVGDDGFSPDAGDDRASNVRAFADAAAGARAAAQTFAARGNAASARHYRALAVQLEQQLD